VISRFRFATVRVVSEQPEQPTTAPPEKDGWLQGTGLALGLCLGTALGLSVVDNLGLSLGLGVAIGVAVDAAQSRRAG
jgi:hypothetical protein